MTGRSDCCEGSRRDCVWREHHSGYNLAMNNQSNAERVDETITTDDGDGGGLRSAYPPDQPLGVEDPARRADGSIAPDDLSSRAWRREPEPQDGSRILGA